MDQTFQIALGVTALLFVVGLPFALFKLFSVRSNHALEALAAWAGARGFTPSARSALPPSHAGHVQAIHYEVGAGTLSLSVAERRQHAYVTFYYRPDAPRDLPPLSVQQRALGASGRPITGDPEFDARFLVSITDGADWASLLHPEARRLLVERHRRSSRSITTKER